MRQYQKKNKYLALTIIFILAFSVFSNAALAKEINSSNVLDLVNQSREADGLPALSENEKLDKIAQDKLNDIISNNYFAHTSPKGVSPWYWYEKNNYDYEYAGENLAINFLEVERQHKAWMESPTHRKNIMNVNYQEIGIAVGAGEINGQMSLITVQEFGTQVGAAEVIDKEKNFSGKENRNLIDEESEKIPPTVLSVKDSTGGKLDDIIDHGVKTQEADFGKALADGFNRNREAIGHYSLMLAIFMLFVSLVVSPSVMVVMAIKEIAKAPKGNYSVYVKYLDNINEKKWVKIHLL